MTYAFSTRERAEKAAEQAASTPGFRPSNLELDRVPVGYEVRVFNHDPLNCSWGVYPLWNYADNAVKSTGFGGPFVPVADFVS